MSVVFRVHTDALSKAHFLFCPKNFNLPNPSSPTKGATSGNQCLGTLPQPQQHSSSATLDASTPADDVSHMVEAIIELRHSFVAAPYAAANGAAVAESCVDRRMGSSGASFPPVSPTCGSAATGGGPVPLQATASSVSLTQLSGSFMDLLSLNSYASSTARRGSASAAAAVAGEGGGGGKSSVAGQAGLGETTRAGTDLEAPAPMHPSGGWICRAMAFNDKETVHAHGAISVNQSLTSKCHLINDVAKGRIMARIIPSFAEVSERFGVTNAELSFERQFISRSDMFLVTEALRERILYEGEELTVCGFRLKVNELLQSFLPAGGAEGNATEPAVSPIHGGTTFHSPHTTANPAASTDATPCRRLVRVGCGIVTPVTRINFLSLSPVHSLIVELSREMWDTTMDGRIYLEWAMKFIRELLLHQLPRRKASPLVCVVFTGRLLGHYAINNNTDVFHLLEIPPETGGVDLTEEVEMHAEALVQRILTQVRETLLRQLPRSSRSGAMSPTASGHRGVDGAPVSSREAVADVNSRSIQAIHRLSPSHIFTVAKQSNTLEALGVVLERCTNHYLGRRLTVTGHSVTVVSAGKGMYQTTNSLMQVNCARLHDVGLHKVHVVCVGRPPLHVTPLLAYADDDDTLRSQYHLYRGDPGEAPRFYYESPAWMDCFFYHPRAPSTTGGADIFDLLPTAEWRRQWQEAPSPLSAVRPRQAPTTERGVPTCVTPFPAGRVREPPPSPGMARRRDAAQDRLLDVGAPRPASPCAAAVVVPGLGLPSFPLPSVIVPVLPSRRDADENAAAASSTSGGVGPSLSRTTRTAKRSPGMPGVVPTSFPAEAPIRSTTAESSPRLTGCSADANAERPGPRSPDAYQCVSRSLNSRSDRLSGPETVSREQNPQRLQQPMKLRRSSFVLKDGCVIRDFAGKGPVVTSAWYCAHPTNASAATPVPTASVTVGGVVDGTQRPQSHEAKTVRRSSGGEDIVTNDAPVSHHQRPSWHVPPSLTRKDVFPCSSNIVDSDLKSGYLILELTINEETLPGMQWSPQTCSDDTNWAMLMESFTSRDDRPALREDGEYFHSDFHPGDVFCRPHSGITSDGRTIVLPTHSNSSSFHAPEEVMFMYRAALFVERSPTGAAVAESVGMTVAPHRGSPNTSAVGTSPQSADRGDADGDGTNGVHVAGPPHPSAVSRLTSTAVHSWQLSPLVSANSGRVDGWPGNTTSFPHTETITATSAVLTLGSSLSTAALSLHNSRSTFMRSPPPLPLATCVTVGYIQLRSNLLFAIQAIRPLQVDVDPNHSGSPCLLPGSGSTAMVFRRRWQHQHPLVEVEPPSMASWTRLCACKILPLYGSKAVYPRDAFYTASPHQYTIAACRSAQEERRTLLEFILQRLQQQYQIVVEAGPQAVYPLQWPRADPAPNIRLEMSLGHQIHTLKLGETARSLSITRMLHRGMYSNGQVTHLLSYHYAVWNYMDNTFDAREMHMEAQVGEKSAYQWAALDQWVQARPDACVPRGPGGRARSVAVVLLPENSRCAPSFEDFLQFIGGCFTPLLKTHGTAEWAWDARPLPTLADRPALSGTPPPASESMTVVLVRDHTRSQETRSVVDPASGRTIAYEQPVNERVTVVDIDLPPLYNPRCHYLVKVLWLSCESTIVTDWLGSFIANAGWHHFRAVPISCYYQNPKFESLEVNSSVFACDKEDAQALHHVLYLLLTTPEHQYYPDTVAIHRNGCLVHVSGLCYAVMRPSTYVVAQWHQNLAVPQGGPALQQLYNSFWAIVEEARRIVKREQQLAGTSPDAAKQAVR